MVVLVGEVGEVGGTTSIDGAGRAGARQVQAQGVDGGQLVGGFGGSQVR